MPSFGIHIQVMDELIAKLQQSTDPEESRLAGLLSAKSEMATLGAIGPDLFYYLDFKSDLLSAIADVFHFTNEISGLLHSAADIVDQAGMPNFGSLVGQIADTSQLTILNIQEGAIASILKINEIITGDPAFSISQQQEEKPVSEWNWGDILHDRHSGEFARMLSGQARASGNPDWQAYVCGYKSHLMTDMAGHPYVNQVVGGPARGWNMRHTLAEKFMDQKIYVNRGKDICQSHIDERMKALKGSPELKSLCRMLSEQVNQLSQTPGLPYGFPELPDDGDIERAFNNMLSLFGYLTNDLYVPPPRRPGIAIPPLPGQAGSLTAAISSLRPPSGNWSLADLLKFLLYLLVIVPAIITDIVKAIADFAIGITTYPIRLLLYFLQTVLYTLFRALRSYLVTAGVAFPYPDELNSELGSQFIFCREPDDGYPRHPEEVNKIDERFDAAGRIFTFQATSERYLHYPSLARPERPTRLSSVYYQGVDPEYFINGIQMDPAFFANWQHIHTPTDLRNISPWPHPGMPPIAGLGNAVDLTRLYINEHFDETIFDKINLDGDRGYGFKQWTCDSGIKTGNIINERFI